MDDITIIKISLLCMCIGLCIAFIGTWSQLRELNKRLERIERKFWIQAIEEDKRIQESIVDKVAERTGYIKTVPSSHIYTPTLSNQQNVGNPGGPMPAHQADKSYLCKCGRYDPHTKSSHFFAQQTWEEEHKNEYTMKVESLLDGPNINRNAEKDVETKGMRNEKEVS